MGGCQKLFEINDEHKVRPFYEKRMGAEVDASTLGEEWNGYIFRITGGNDKQGFPMKQGVLTQGRVRLLLSKGHSCYRQRRSGERKRKSVRGCIVDGNLSVISVVIVKKGDSDIPGLTDVTIPRRLAPKRASKIRKLFNLTKDDNVCHYVIKRPLPVKEGKKPQFKAPKVQRFVVKRKRAEKNRQAAAEYAKILAQRQKEAKEAKELRRKRSASLRESRNSVKSS